MSTGPHQSIIACFTSGGHGAAAWTATCTPETSYFARTASASFSIRTNIVGTACRCVTPYCSMAASMPSASKRSIITTVPPMDWIVAQKRSGAA